MVLHSRATRVALRPLPATARKTARATPRPHAAHDPVSEPEPTCIFIPKCRWFPFFASTTAPSRSAPTTPPRKPDQCILIQGDRFFCEMSMRM